MLKKILPIFIGVLAILGGGFYIAEAAGCTPFFVASGGTGNCAFTSNAVVLGNGTGKLATTTAGTNGFVLALVGGVPTWVATSSINNGVSSITVPQGTFTGALTFSTTSNTTNGITSSLTITGSGSTLTFGSNQSGTLSVAGGGTGAATLTGCLTGNGTGAITGSGTCNTSTLATSTALANTQVLFATGINTFGSNSAFTFVVGTGLMTVTNASTTSFSSSQELNPPHGTTAAPALTAGDLYVNTNGTASSSIDTNDGSVNHYLFATHSFSAVLASSTLSYYGAFGAAGTTTTIIANPLHSSTLRSAFCKTDVGTAYIVFGNGSATTTAFQCTATGAGSTISSNNTWSGRQPVFLGVGNTGSSPNLITITADVEDSN